MNDKYVKLADVKRKLRYIFKAYGVGSFVREKIERTLNNLPYSVKGDLETTLEATDVQPVNQWISVGDKLPEWDKTVLVWYASYTLFGVSEGYLEDGKPVDNNMNFCPMCGARMDKEAQ